MNNVNIIGNLVRNPEEFQVGENSKAVFSIANNRRFKKRDGSNGEEVTFIECQAWGNKAATVMQWLGKGHQVAVTGRLCYDQWQDKDGNNRSKHYINVDDVDFLRKPGENPQSTQTPPQRPAPMPDDDTDIPF